MKYVITVALLLSQITCSFAQYPGDNGNPVPDEDAPTIRAIKLESGIPVHEFAMPVPLQMTVPIRGFQGTGTMRSGQYLFPASLYRNIFRNINYFVTYLPELLDHPYAGMTDPFTGEPML